MAVSKIEQLIEDIYEFVESCKMQPLSTTKVVVPKDELYDLLDELRLRTPDEIKRYQKIIQNRDAILANAEEKAAGMMANAESKIQALVDEHEIMQQAYQNANDVVSEASIQARQILEDANRDANEIRQGALEYTDRMLTDVENILGNAYESTKNKYENLLSSLKGNLDIVINNKRELGLESEAASGAEEAYYEGLPEEFENFDENTFLDDVD